VSEQLQGASLYRRLLQDHRRIIIPLAVALALNVLAYAFLVYPLAQRVANVEQRNQSAEQELALARREYDNARGALTGKERATVELATFYKDILPSDLTGARRLTYLRLAQLVREAGLAFKTSVYEPQEERDSTLRRLRIALNVQGNWENIRTLIYQLDTAPEFVVIDNIVVAEATGEDRALDLGLQLSTYYRAVEP
jgi:Tfp pilus assembly protein PilO